MCVYVRAWLKFTKFYYVRACLKFTNFYYFYVQTIVNYVSMQKVLQF